MNVKSGATFPYSFFHPAFFVWAFLLVTLFLIAPQGAVSAEIDMAGGDVDFDLVESRLSLELQPASNRNGYSTILLDQQGKENLAVVYQSGEMNFAEVLQYGANNYAQVDQFGIDNRAVVKQVGTDNYADILQYGVSNSAAVSQHGGQSFSLEQIGDHMEVNIVQD